MGSLEIPYIAVHRLVSGEEGHWCNTAWAAPASPVLSVSAISCVLLLTRILVPLFSGKLPATDKAVFCWQQTLANSLEKT